MVGGLKLLRVPWQVVIAASLEMARRVHVRGSTYAPFWIRALVVFTIILFLISFCLTL